MSLSLKNLAAGAFAAASVLAASTAFAAPKVVDAEYHAISGSQDFFFFGYFDESGQAVSLVGQQILGARAEVQFTPKQEADLASFRMNMVVPVVGAKSEFFQVTGDQLIPMGHGKYYADLTSSLFNGTVREGRFSIEVFTLGDDGNPYSLHGKLGAKTAFHFIVTAPAAQ